MVKLVLLRHGESTWNMKNLFTGWIDVPLSGKGVAEARAAAAELKKRKYSFDVVFTNVHKRTLKTVGIVLERLRLHVPVHKAWQLNERHYGALIGLNKAKTAQRYGEKQVLMWRRSYSVRPPALKKTDQRYKAILRSYPGIPRKYFPLAESLKDTYKRTVPYWKGKIAPEIKKGKRVLIVASHNSLRSLVKYFDRIPDRRIPEYTIPTAVPLVYELDSMLRPRRHYYLGKSSEIRNALARIAAQGMAKG